MNRGEALDTIMTSALPPCHRLVLIEYTRRMPSALPVDHEEAISWPGPTALVEGTGFGMTVCKAARRDLEQWGILTSAGEGARGVRRFRVSWVTLATWKPCASRPGRERTGSGGAPTPGQETTGSGGDPVRRRPPTRSAGDRSPGRQLTTNPPQGTHHKEPTTDPPNPPQGGGPLPAWVGKSRRIPAGLDRFQLLASVCRVLEAWTGAPVPDPAAAGGEGRQVLELLLTLDWPDLATWEPQALLLGEAARRCPVAQFARDVRGSGWEGRGDRSRSVRTLADPVAWGERLRLAEAWCAAGRPSTTRPPMGQLPKGAPAANPTPMSQELRTWLEKAPSDTSAAEYLRDPPAHLLEEARLHLPDLVPQAQAQAAK